MRSNDIFRFVVMRQPDQSAVASLATDSNPEVSGSLKERIEKLEADGASKEQAQATLADEIFKSDNYVTRNKIWAQLLPHWLAISSLLLSLQGQPRAVAKFRKWFDDNLGQARAHRWLMDNLEELKTSAWKSYYANLLKPDANPNELTLCSQAIRFAFLLENSSDADQFAGALAALANFRPMIDVEVVSRITEPASPPEQIPPNVDKAVENVKKLTVELHSLERLREAARLALKEKQKNPTDQSYNLAGMARIDELSASVADLRALVINLQTELGAEGATSENVPGMLMMSPVPQSSDARPMRWYVTAGDLEKHGAAEVGKLLLQYRLDLDELDGNQLLGRLDELIAIKHRDIMLARRKYRYTYIHGALVRYEEELSWADRY